MIERGQRSSTNAKLKQIKEMSVAKRTEARCDIWKSGIRVEESLSEGGAEIESERDRQPRVLRK